MFLVHPLSAQTQKMVTETLRVHRKRREELAQELAEIDTVIAALESYEIFGEQA